MPKVIFEVQLGLLWLCGVLGYPFAIGRDYFCREQWIYWQLIWVDSAGYYSVKR
jgi:hypothetical protein